MSNEMINEVAHRFLNDKVGYRKTTASWYKKAYRFHQLSMDELQHLSVVSKTPIRELVFEHGFGRAKVTIDEIARHLKEEGEGWQVTITDSVAA